MNTMRREMIEAGVLWVCVLVAVIGARAADSGSVKVESHKAEGAIILLDDVSPDRLIPLPETYSVKKRYSDGHPMNNALAGAAESCSLEQTKEIYSSKLGTFVFPPGRGRRIADDLITELVRDCSICSLQVRVTGGVEGGGGTFLADFSLYDACPAAGEGGQEIPGTRLRFSDLQDDADLFHDLILDYSDRGICDDGSSCFVSQQNCTGGTCNDGSACDSNDPNCGDGSECVSSGFVCVADPLEIPPTVWVRLRFSTDDAAIVMGAPPTRGFSTDGYDDPQAACSAWFAGWPAFPHATMFAEIIAPATCETHFLAYLAANPSRPAFLPSDIGPIPLPGGGTRPPMTTPTTRLGDDIRLTVDNCTLSAYELGMKGNVGHFLMQMDLRWPDVQTVQQDTVHTFTGRGESSAEIAHVTIDEDVNLSIGPDDQPIVITWKSNKANTGAMEVDTTQAGTSQPTMLAFDVDPQNPNTWTILGAGDSTPAVFYAAIFCRGDAPRGACCPDQPDTPGSDTTCLDDLPVTSCLGARWQINSTCEQFNPPCGTHSCCLPAGHCENRTFDDCVEECIADEEPIFCEPVCNGGENDRQPCHPANGDADCAPDGICDPDASCPGQRTCGLTACQRNGVFTDRPCDLDNPDRGASDCMTCSGNGEYCRPRCVGGLNRGRPCDDHTDCPGGTCDNNVDCPMGHTCRSIQTCEHEANQCDLRCARWSAGEFCAPNGVEGDCLFDPGACCLDTDCSLATEFLCLESGGIFFGPGTACDTPDADTDGLRDECDLCPADSNKFEPGVCGCGVVDPDSPLFLGTHYAAGSRPVSVAIGDLNGDRIPDLAVANSSIDDVSVLLGVGDGTFAAPVHYAAGTKPNGIAIGDLDGDEMPDLAVANLDSNDVSVLPGVGDGTFAAAVHYGAGAGPASIAISDLNGDRVPDMAVANAFSENVSVLLGVGDGTFVAAVHYPANSVPHTVAIGDLNGDKVPDLAVPNFNFHYISVLLGLGDGTFAAAARYTAGDQPVSVAIGELNGDQLPDLAVTNWGSGSVSVLLGIGNGTFAAPVHYAVGFNPLSVCIGDLDGDQVSDLAVTNGGSNNVSVLLGVGDGLFGPAEHVAAGNAPISVACGDLDGDQTTDLAVANLNGANVTVLLNQSSIDCNGNGVSDVCDIDCGAPEGPCDLHCCGQSEDCNGNGVPDDCELDSDGDGLLDDCDACPDSDLAKLIAIEECPTGVTNELLDDGCTMNDVLAECSIGAHNHGQFKACVARHANEWRRQGLLAGKDVGHIVHCAGTSNERRPSKRVKDDRTHGRR